MARIKVVPTSAANYSLADFISYFDTLLTTATISTHNANRFVATFNAGGTKVVSTVNGSGFKYTGDYDPAVYAGVFSSIVVKAGGATLGTISNINTSIASALNAEYNGTNRFALEQLFLSKSWSYVGTNANDVATASTRVGDGYQFNPQGNDIIFLRGGNDKMFAGDGNDLVKGEDGNDHLFGGSGKDKLFGGAGVDTLNGDADSDQLSGGSGKDKLFGGGGADTLNGDADNDQLFGGSGRDKLLGGTGADTLNGDADSDQLSGGSGKDKLFGGSGADTLNGGGGDDTLCGDQGNDSLYGKTGQDRFVFDDGFGKDKIFDFKPNVDTIDLRPYSGLTKFADLDIHKSASGDAVIDLGTDEITLIGVKVDALDAGDFLI